MRLGTSSEASAVRISHVNVVADEFCRKANNFAYNDVAVVVGLCQRLDVEYTRWPFKFMQLRPTR